VIATAHTSIAALARAVAPPRLRVVVD
jgi:hypothetical protein